MKAGVYPMLGAALALSAAIVWSIAVPNPAPAFDADIYGEPVWRDEFDMLSLNSDGAGTNWADHFVHWNVRHLEGNGDLALKGSDGMILSDGSSAATHITGIGGFDGPPFLHEVTPRGTLLMRSYPAPSGKDFGGFPYIAGMLSGEMSHAQNRGYWEVRLRAYVPTGHHLALWLVDNGGAWPPEIDMLEVVGNEPERFFTNAIFEGEGHKPINFFAPPESKDGWHVLGFAWGESELTWLVDGQIARQQPNLLGDHEMSLLLTWEVGSDWPGEPDGDTAWPGEVEIDYVRIYAEP